MDNDADPEMTIATPGQQDIAKIYGVCQRTISLIVRGEAWKEGVGK